MLLTTHDLSDVEKLCERVLIIDHGAVLFDGRLAALTERFGGRRALVVDFEQSHADPQIAGAELIALEGPRATYHFDRGALSAAELIARIAARYPVADLTVREPDIEDTVRRIYEERLLS